MPFLFDRADEPAFDASDRGVKSVGVPPKSPSSPALRAVASRSPPVRGSCEFQHRLRVGLVRSPQKPPPSVPVFTYTVPGGLSIVDDVHGPPPGQPDGVVSKFASRSPVTGVELHDFARDQRAVANRGDADEDAPLVEGGGAPHEVPVFGRAEGMGPDDVARVRVERVVAPVAASHVEQPRRPCPDLQGRHGRGACHAEVGGLQSSLVSSPRLAVHTSTPVSGSVACSRPSHEPQ